MKSIKLHYKDFFYKLKSNVEQERKERLMNQFSRLNSGELESVLSWAAQSKKKINKDKAVKLVNSEGRLSFEAFCNLIE